MVVQPTELALLKLPRSSCIRIPTSHRPGLISENNDLAFLDNVRRATAHGGLEEVNDAVRQLRQKQV